MQQLATAVFVLAAAAPAPPAHGMPGAVALTPPAGHGAPAERAPRELRQTQASEVLRVFLDCQGRTCDDNYLRQEITFINWVRDPRDADVHILVTTRGAASGREFTLAFLGQGDFEGDDLEHLFVSSSTDTEDETRRQMAQVLRVGLLHYMAGSAVSEQIEIRRRQVQQRQRQPTMVQSGDDPWNFWVFSAGFDGELDGEQRRTSQRINGNFSANRTTEAWKVRLSTRLNYNQRRFELNDGSDVLSITRNFNANGQVVKSIGPHWGASIKTTAMHATSLNQDLTVSLEPGIEYNVFPYSESSRRQLTFTYEIGAAYYTYQEPTIFEETAELLYDESLLVNYDLRQAWGQVSFGGELAHFFHDFGEYHAAVDGRIDIRVTRGLSFDINGNYSVIRDQRYLSAGDLTDEEILLERRQLATSFRYSVSFGVNYTFGSIYNNVVNPRFGGSRGDMRRFFR